MYKETPNQIAASALYPSFFRKVAFSGTRWAVTVTGTAGDTRRQTATIVAAWGDPLLLGANVRVPDGPGMVPPAEYTIFLQN